MTADLQRGSAEGRSLAAFLDDPAVRLYLQPLVLPPGCTDIADSLPLAGGPLSFAAGIVHARADDAAGRRFPLGLDEIRALAAERRRRGDSRLDELLAAASAPRRAVAGIAFDRPRLMGVLNVTPDSFSDGGAYLGVEAAVAHGRALIAAGADIVDIGGESTRPGAAPVQAATEIERVIGPIRGLVDAGRPLSIDTRHAAVMAAAVAAGCALVNDVSALADDPASLATVARLGVPVVLMHKRGEPATMQQAPVYADVLLDVYDHLAGRIAACAAAGIPRARLILDPGIGFGKTLAHNLALLAGLSIFHGLGCPLLVGVSRKSFLVRLGAPADAKARLPGSLAAGLAALGQGAQVLRVHDVAETAQAVSVWSALAAGGR